MAFVKIDNQVMPNGIIVEQYGREIAGGVILRLVTTQSGNIVGTSAEFIPGGTIVDGDIAVVAPKTKAKGGK